MIYLSKYHCLPTGICNSLVSMVCFRLSNSFNKRAGGNGADSSSGHTELLCGWTRSTTPLMCGKSKKLPVWYSFLWVLYCYMHLLCFSAVFSIFVFLMLAFAMYFYHDLWIISTKGIHCGHFFRDAVLEMF